RSETWPTRAPLPPIKNYEPPRVGRNRRRGKCIILRQARVLSDLNRSGKKPCRKLPLRRGLRVLCSCSTLDSDQTFIYDLVNSEVAPKPVARRTSGTDRSGVSRSFGGATVIVPIGYLRRLVSIMVRSRAEGRSRGGPQMSATPDNTSANP